MKYFYFFSIAILIMIGCSTSRVTKSWKNENIVSKSYKKVLVLGLFGQLDRDYRVKMEEHMVGDLSNLGYKAISSVKQYGSKAFENMGEKEALTNLAEFGFDAVVTIVLLNKEKEINFIPAKTQNTSYWHSHSRFWNYYSTIYDKVYMKEYYAESTKYFWETNLYNLDDSTLVYSAQSQTFDPTSPQNFGHEYGLMIIKDMVKQGVVQKQVLQEPALKSF